MSSLYYGWKKALARLIVISEPFYDSIFFHSEKKGAFFEFNQYQCRNYKKLKFYFFLKDVDQNYIDH